MLPPALSFSFSIFSLMMLSVLSKSTTNSNIYVQCSQLYFDSMTPYESNLNSLFTSLVDTSSIYNFNKFQIYPPAGYSQDDVVYGLFQCRGDLSSSNCKECVTSSVSQLKTNCPVSTGGGIQLDGCFVKYDNSSFFGAEDKMEVLKRCGPSVGYNSDVLNRIDNALAYLIAGNGEYFRSNDYGSILGVAQCVQDLSISDCQDCLSKACGLLRTECEASTWGDMYLGKCYIRYVDQGSDSHAYNGTSTSDKSSGRGISSSDIKKWIGIILAAMTATGGVTAYAVKNSNRNTNRNTNRSDNDNKLIVNIDQGVQKVERDLKDMGTEVKNMGTEVKNMGRRVENLESDVGSTKKNTEVLQGIAKELPKNYPAYGTQPYPMCGTPQQYQMCGVENQNPGCTIM